MRKLILILAALVLLFGCVAQQAVKTEPIETMVADNSKTSAVMIGVMFEATNCQFINELIMFNEMYGRNGVEVVFMLEGMPFFAPAGETENIIYALMQAGECPEITKPYM